MSKMSDYIEQQLGAAGFVLCNATIAYRLRRDLWGSRMDVEVSGADARKYLATLASQMPLVLFTFEGKDLQGFGACFNAERLEERIREIYGLKLKIAVVDSLQQPVPAELVQDAKAHAAQVKQEKLEKLRSIAAQPLPNYDCHDRKEILAARAELERLGESLKSAPASPAAQPKQPVASTPAQPVSIGGDDDYHQLPSGALFVGPDGVTRKKP